MEPAVRAIIGELPTMAVPLFDCGYVVVCRTREDWQALHERLNIDSGEESANGMSHTVINNMAALFLVGVFNDEASTLAHECAHMAFDICHRVGVEVEPGRANETFCYLLGKLVGFCGSPVVK